MRPEIGLSDAKDRLVAETTFDRNVVVIAGAGTGKTTLLVNRLIHGLLRETGGFTLTQIVALTFTNKAAQEMKTRLRDRLQALLASDSQGTPQETQEYCERYHLSGERFQEKIHQALNDLEKSHIRTLHSFAAHILRLYPLEAGVVPQFQEDDGTDFSELFQETWQAWLEDVLGTTGESSREWKALFRQLSLQSIKDFAFGLCADFVSLPELGRQWTSSSNQDMFLEWLEGKRDAILRLLEAHSTARPRKIEQMLEAALQVFERTIPSLPGQSIELSEDDRRLLNASPGKAPKGWETIDFEEANRAILSAKRLIEANPVILHAVIQLLSPFVDRLHQRFSEKGRVRFDGLLVRVRNVLRDFPRVRRELKSDFQAILVDEFQDTDPLQYEIVLYLAETLGKDAKDWRDVSLVPGKLFIVGDPKQSIYAFRRADIEAFDQVVEKLIRDGAERCTLTTNFRSQPAILHFVNEVFDRLFVPRPNVQPQNIALDAGRPLEEMKGPSPVEISVVAQGNQDAEWNAETATYLEAQWLAQWIRDQLTQERNEVGEKGRAGRLRPGHFAVLFRKFTNAHVYLEALHRQGLAYITEDARHFYRRQEVVDMVNILRVLDDPTDSIALVGVLRSSLGGVPDREIMELFKGGTVDVRHPSVLSSWKSDRKPAVQLLFTRLAALSQQAHSIPIPDLLEQLLNQLPILELAAASSHGEQAVVNIWKLRDGLLEQARQPQNTFRVCVHRLVESLRTQDRESEGQLAEETWDAVRVMTIHKAKGLEFPIVILPGLHQLNTPTDPETEVSRDWMSGMYGCRLSSFWNREQVMLEDKHRIREEAEQRRVLYVGMTRARERLILSGGLLGRRNRGSFLGMLQSVIQGEWGNVQETALQLGKEKIHQTVILPHMLDRESPSKGERSQEQHEQGRKTFSSAAWRTRQDIWAHARETISFFTPSDLKDQSSHMEGGRSSTISQQHTRQLGIWVHQFLEHWGYEEKGTVFHDAIRTFHDHLPLAVRAEHAEVLVDMTDVLTTFSQSAAYQELQQARIIGREVPFLLQWPTGQDADAFTPLGVMEGRVDVIYESQGEWWVGDYKTDRVESGGEKAYAERYLDQAKVYTLAMRKTLDVDVKGCKLFFLRTGVTIPVDLDEDFKQRFELSNV